MKRILIVDDDDKILSMLEKYLKKEYNAHGCSDALQAFTLVIEQKPDLVILDIEMPKMDGIEFCSLMKNSEFARNIPILIITGASEVSMNKKIEEMLEFQHDGYLTKPFGVKELKEKVESLLNIK